MQNTDKSSRPSGAAVTDDASMPLRGLRVLLLSPTQTGVQAGQLLADFGAEVVHVERTGGSALREQPAWPFWARGSCSIELDLHDEADVEVARRLAADSDVVIETFRPGVAARLGLGHEELSSLNPGLVYCSISGFGSKGAYADLQGYEGVVMAKTGVLWHMAGLAGGQRPAFPSALYSSFPATQLALQGILTALLEREDSGLGQRVETSLAQGLTVHDTFGWFARVVANRFGEGFSQSPVVVEGIPTGGLSFRLLIALTQDGHWLQFSQVVDRLFRAMMDVLDLGWVLDDPEWAGAPDFDDVDKRVAFWELLLRAVNARPLAEWQRRFDANPDVWAETFLKDNEVLDHPQSRWNRMVTEIDDPERGPVLQPSAVVRMDDTAWVGTPAPTLGQHERELRDRVAGKPDRFVGQADGGRDPAVPSETTAVLDGVTVLELGTYYAAPFGATLLADYGATVIKIEEPGGDPMRNMLPFPDVAGIKAVVGKKSIALDIRSEHGQAIVRELARSADVVLQSFRAGVAERLGLDAASLRAVNPDLVYLTAPGYGADGPCGHRPAYAPTIGAAVGLAHRNAGPSIEEHAGMDIEEIKRGAVHLMNAVMGGGNADGYAAVTAGTAMTLGLLARRRGFGGQNLFTTMLSTATHALSEDMVRYEGRGTVPVVDDGVHGFGALYRLYPAADGWVFLAAPSQPEWLRLDAALRRIGAPGGLLIAGDPRFRTVKTRLKHQSDLVDLLSEVFLEHSATEWETILRSADVACVEVVRGPVEAGYLDEGSVGQLSGFVTECLHPTLGTVPRLAPLVRFSRSATIAGDSCAIGQHTVEILEGIGYDADSIAKLEADGVIRR